MKEPPELAPTSVTNALPWLTWVHVLTIVGVLLAGGTNSRSPGKTPVLAMGSAHVHVSEANADGLSEKLSFELDRPLDYRLEVPIAVTDGSAHQGEHYTVRRRPHVIFEPGSTQGSLSGEGAACDIVILDDYELLGDEPRFFDVKLGMVEGIVDLDASRSTCRVSIDDDEKPPTPRIKIRFASSGGELRESQVASHSLAMKADGPADDRAEMTVVVQQKAAKEPKELGRTTFFLEPGQTDLTFRLSDVVSLDRLKAAGLTDDDVPGPPTELAVCLRGQHPLFADEPRDLAFRVIDDDPAAKLGMLVQDEAGRQLDRILPGSPFWIVADVDRGIRLGTPFQICLDKGSPMVTGTLAPGARSIRLGPLNAAPGSERMIDIALEVPAQSAAHPYVEPATLTRRLPKGPKDGGRFAMIVVNTSQLQEPGNGILEAVWAYMNKAVDSAFGKGVLLVGPSKSEFLTAPAMPLGEDVFRPLVKEGQGIAGQLKRVSDVVVKVRHECEDPSIRIVVVWAERGLGSPAALGRLRPVDRPRLSPISFLCPSPYEWPGSAIRDALVGVGEIDGEDFTIRCPDRAELTDHIRWAIDGFELPGKTR